MVLVVTTVLTAKKAGLANAAALRAAVRQSAQRAVGRYYRRSAVAASWDLSELGSHAVTSREPHFIVMRRGLVVPACSFSQSAHDG